jgi:hypothetical protein
MLENTERATKNSKSGETSNTGCTRRRKHNTICVGQHYLQTDINNVRQIKLLLNT